MNNLTDEQKRQIAAKIDWEGLDYYMANYAFAQAEEFECEDLRKLSEKWESLQQETEKWIEDNGIHDCWPKDESEDESENV